MIKLKLEIQHFSKNFLRQLLGAIVSSGTRQLVLLPILAKLVEVEIYGTILTIIAIINIASVALGNTLNNVRLISETNYHIRGFSGDFNILIVSSSTIIVLLIPILYIVFPQLSIMNSVILALFLFFETLISYYRVIYRLELNFSGALKNNILSALGSLLGLFLAYATGLWAVAYLMSTIFSFIYLFPKNHLVQEPFRSTPLLKQTLGKWGVLIFTSLVANGLLYLDRFLLYPIIGPKAVSIYNVSTFLGKSFGAILTPIAGVLLGYYAQDTFYMTIKRFWYINGIVIIFSMMFYLFIVVFGNWMTGIFYPTLIDQASQYILLANLGAVLSGIGILTQVSVLRYAKTYWQIIIQITYSFVYIGLALITLNHWGLLGFCYAAISANFIKLFMLFIIGQKSLKEDLIN